MNVQCKIHIDNFTDEFAEEEKPVISTLPPALPIIVPDEPASNLPKPKIITEEVKCFPPYINLYFVIVIEHLPFCLPRAVNDFETEYHKSPLNL